MCAAVCYTEYHSGKQHHSISVEYNCYIHVGFKYEETKKLMKEFKQWPFHLVYVSNSSAQLNHREPIYYSNYICHFVCIYNVRMKFSAMPVSSILKSFLANVWRNCPPENFRRQVTWKVYNFHLETTFAI